jgi:diguanylate cyclase (GGDEF)-like protein
MILKQGKLAIAFAADTLIGLLLGFGIGARFAEHLAGSNPHATSFFYSAALAATGVALPLMIGLAIFRRPEDRGDEPDHLSQLQFFSKKDSGAIPEACSAQSFADGQKSSGVLTQLHTKGASWACDGSCLPPEGIPPNSLRGVEGCWADNLTLNPSLQDPLTGLPNRTAFEGCLERLIRLAARSQKSVAVLVIDLDRFRSVNDSFGRSVGDRFLVALAARLRAIMRKGDTLSRFSGDQFAIAMPAVLGCTEVAQIASKVVAAVSEPFEFDGNVVQVSGSLGISQYPRDAGTATELLRYADTAVHAAKHHGRGTCREFTPTLTQAVQHKQKLDCDLYRACSRNEFVVHYQPFVNAVTGQITGVEALLRWRHPEHGMMSPAHFIPELEEMGLIGEVGQQTLKEACRQSAAWQQLGIPPIRTAVNISHQQLYETDIAGTVQTVLNETGLDPRWLELEITESKALDSSEATIQIMRNLRRIGVSLALDDFGTGWSSLSYLTRLPFDRIKIDQSFVRNIGLEPATNAVVENILDLGRRLGIACIAEGVETALQRDYLKKLGCPELQGFLFSRVLSALDCTALLRSTELHMPCAGAAGSQFASAFS